MNFLGNLRYILHLPFGAGGDIVQWVVQFHRLVSVAFGFAALPYNPQLRYEVSDFRFQIASIKSKA